MTGTWAAACFFLPPAAPGPVPCELTTCNLYIGATTSRPRARVSPPAVEASILRSRVCAETISGVGDSVYKYAVCAAL